MNRWNYDLVTQRQDDLRRAVRRSRPRVMVFNGRAALAWLRAARVPITRQQRRQRHRLTERAAT
jgi:hypothetical protein